MNCNCKYTRKTLVRDVIHANSFPAKNPSHTSFNYLRLLTTRNEEKIFHPVVVISHFSRTKKSFFNITKKLSHLHDVVASEWAQWSNHSTLNCEEKFSTKKTNQRNEKILICGHSFYQSCPRTIIYCAKMFLLCVIISRRRRFVEGERFSVYLTTLPSLSFPPIKCSLLMINDNME